MDISIIIVNYNTEEHLIKCINSLQKIDNDVKYEIIVVDNNSTNTEIKSFDKLFPNVRFLFRNINDGFGAGCNYGVKYAVGKYLLFINPDIELIDKCFEILMSFLEINKNVGLISGLQIDRQENILNCFNDYPNFMWELYHLIGFGYEQKIRKLNTRKEILKNENFEVDWFHGAFLFLSKEDFENAGKFNEDYFMYYEDVELCFNIKHRLNKTIVCLPMIRIFHQARSSLDHYENDNVYFFHIHRGKLIFLKNYKLFKRNLMKLISLMSIIIRICYLPIWKKYRRSKRKKYNQLIKILKLYFNKRFLQNSKFEYINN